MTIILDGTTGITSPGGDVSVSQSLSGNLTFTGTGNRITGDFSNATIANRVMFQTSTVNGATQVRAIPSGTGTVASVQAGNSSDPNNQSAIAINATSAECSINSQINGTGTYLPMTFYTGGSERMRIDTSGNVGIGTSSPLNRVSVAGGLSSTGGDAAGAGAAAISMHYSTSSDAGMISSLSNGVAWKPLQLRSNTLLFKTSSDVEAARFDSSGNLLVGITSKSFTSTSYSVQLGAPNTESFFIVNDVANIIAMNRNTNGDMFKFFRSGSQVGGISVNTTNTTYSTSSDYRLKHDIQPMTGALGKVAALKPVTYKWNADDSAGEGFIAHELQEVAPYAVSGEKDGEQMQGVDYGKLTPILTAALQEAIAKIEILEARIAVLEAK